MKYKAIMIVVLFFALFQFLISASYQLPFAAYSLDVKDIDLDGDKDIVVGHEVAWEHTNPSISILENNGYGDFDLIDTSMVFCGYQDFIRVEKVNADEYPDIKTDYVHVDAICIYFIENPEWFDVIVTDNMFGDIISDGFAGLVGGLGFACSANIGETAAVFEPTHGSAPKYEKLNPSIVNPIAMFMSAVMMLEHIGENEIANKIKTAISAVVLEGKVQSYDMMKLRGSAEVFSKGAASTQQITDAVIGKL